ncbi:hypothetical protein [Nocardia asteroides]
MPTALASDSALAGLAVIVALHSLPATDEWNELPLALGIGLGLLIVLAIAPPGTQRWSFGGLIAGGVLGFQFDTRFEPDHHRYGDFPASSVVAQQPWQFAVAGLAAVALLAAMCWLRGSE